MYITRYNRSTTEAEWLIVRIVCVCVIVYHPSKPPRPLVLGVFGRQESAPTDVSGLIGAIYDRINEDLDDVLKLEINYVGGVIHRYNTLHTYKLVTKVLPQLLQLW